MIDLCVLVLLEKGAIFLGHPVVLLLFSNKKTNIFSMANMMKLFVIDLKTKVSISINSIESASYHPSK